jgi:D-arabinose 1-dehydrogenase-like Zn-dependent alcohol dehydrogenase
LGAESFIDFKKTSDMIEDVKKLTNGGPHAVIIIAASAKPYEDALKMYRTKGTVVAVGLPADTVISANF